MPCDKCKKTICCCKIVISRKGLRGKDGPKGPKGPASTNPGVQIVGQSAYWGGMSGPLTQLPGHTILNNLESNFFNIISNFYTISVGLTVTSTLPHTLTAYFRKNGVQVGVSFVRDMQPNDYLHFHTDLHAFIAGDLLDLYIETNSADAQVSPGHLLNYKQLF